MNNPALCPVCSSAIPVDAPGGICPVCALRGAALSTAPFPASSGPGGMPGLDEVAAAFPDLEILDVIGQGGMGIVFRVRQPRLDRIVALKILPPYLANQPGFSARFTREARALAKLSHPHIVTVHDFGESGGLWYLLMEHVNGVNLRQAMRAGVKPEMALSLVPRICEALQYAHDHGVLHRDIKPENILLDTAGTPKLADFGIAKLSDDQTSGLTRSGAALGTAAYMAPEQIERPATVDHRADIYSLGVVLYEMLTGELPLGRFGSPSEKAAVAPRVDEVVMRALEKERERRQQSAAEMKTQVEDAGAAAAVIPETWQIRCGVCGRTAGYTASTGGIRIGAASVGKRTLAFCSECGCRRMAHVEPWGSFPGARYVTGPLGRAPRGGCGHGCGTLVSRMLLVLTVTAALAIPVAGALGWRIPSPGHLAVLVSLSGLLYGLSQAFLREPPGNVTAAAALPRSTQPPAAAAGAAGAPDFESRSALVLFGLPLYHIVRGINPATGTAPAARGIFALGPVARGFFAFGGRAHGVIAMGGVATGVVTFGGISVGVFALGGFSAGLLCAAGGMAVGSLVFGGGMAGLGLLTDSIGGSPMNGRMLAGPFNDSAGTLVPLLREAALYSAGGIAALTTVMLLLLFLARPGTENRASRWPACLFSILAMIIGVPPAVILLTPPSQWLHRLDGMGTRVKIERRITSSSAGETVAAFQVQTGQQGYYRAWFNGTGPAAKLTPLPDGHTTGGSVVLKLTPLRDGRATRITVSAGTASIDEEWGIPYEEAAAGITGDQPSVPVHMETPAFGQWITAAQIGGVPLRIAALESGMLTAPQGNPAPYSAHAPRGMLMMGQVLITHVAGKVVSVQPSVSHRDNEPAEAPRPFAFSVPVRHPGEIRFSWYVHADPADEKTSGEWLIIAEDPANGGRLIYEHRESIPAKVSWSTAIAWFEGDGRTPGGLSSNTRLLNAQQKETAEDPAGDWWSVRLNIYSSRPEQASIQPTLQLRSLSSGVPVFPLPPGLTAADIPPSITAPIPAH